MHHLVCSRDGLVSECREYFPRRFQVEFAEFLRHLRRLVHDSTQFGVVAHLSISYCQLDDTLRFAVRITRTHIFRKSDCKNVQSLWKYLSVSSEREVLPEGMALKAVIRQNAAHVRMVIEPHAVHIVRFAFVPEQRRNNEKKGKE